MGARNQTILLIRLSAKEICINLGNMVFILFIVSKILCMDIRCPERASSRSPGLCGERPRTTPGRDGIYFQPCQGWFSLLPLPGLAKSMPTLVFVMQPLCGCWHLRDAPHLGDANWNNPNVETPAPALKCRAILFAFRGDAFRE
jgi:hypothetical protein